MGIYVRNEEEFGQTEQAGLGALNVSTQKNVVIWGDKLIAATRAKSPTALLAAFNTVLAETYNAFAKSRKRGYLTLRYIGASINRAQQYAPLKFSIASWPTQSQLLWAAAKRISLTERK